MAAFHRPGLFLLATVRGQADLLRIPASRSPIDLLVDMLSRCEAPQPIGLSFAPEQGVGL